VPYYRGDYVGGDSNYYRGDPFLGAIALGAKAIGGKLVAKAGRWVGRQTVGGLIGKGAATAATGVVIGKATKAGGVTISPSDIMPGGEPFIEFGRGGRRKYRKMNPLNPKALRRALRRAEGFEKFAKRTMSGLYKPGSSRKFKKATKTRS
jgi:hypothetical protein